MPPIVLTNLNCLVDDTKLWCSYSLVVRAIPDLNSTEEIEIDLATLPVSAKKQSQLPMVPIVKSGPLHALLG